MKSSELKKKAMVLASRPGENFLELARCLRMLHEFDPHQIRVGIEKSGLGRRKAYHLLHLSRQLDPANLPKSRLRNIGWTKLEVIAGRLNRENANELLKLAEDHAYRDLKRLIRGEQVEPGARYVQLYFKPQQYRVFEDAVLRHGGNRRGRGLQKKETAVIQMIRQSRTKRSSS
jgi:hypothetical protein